MKTELEVRTAAAEAALDTVEEMGLPITFETIELTILLSLTCRKALRKAFNIPADQADAEAFTLS